MNKIKSIQDGQVSVVDELRVIDTKVNKGIDDVPNGSQNDSR